MMGILRLARHFHLEKEMIITEMKLKSKYLIKEEYLKIFIIFTVNLQRNSNYST